MRRARARGDDVVQQHGVEAAVRQVRVRVDVVLVGDRDEAVLALRSEQHLVGLRAAQRADAPSGSDASDTNRAVSARADGQHFAELEIRAGDGEAGAAGGRCPRRRSCRCRSRRVRRMRRCDVQATWTNCGVRPSPCAISAATSTSKPRRMEGWPDRPRRTARRPPRRRPSEGRETRPPGRRPARQPGG